MEFLTSGYNILLIILGFGLLIFVHELGHFLAAKWAGIRTEAFAIGMGPVLLAWRRGIGLRFGSTHPDYLRRVEQFLADDAHATANQKLSEEQIRRVADRLGLGETEYSLRWLPIGGFVKMLGQEDANPNAVSDDPRSYNRCPVPKRMIVVSAGVIMNLIAAVIFFIWAFMVGVRFEAPVVGDVVATLPAARALPENAQELGISQAGLKPGDEVTHIDGKKAKTFADLQIAAAMSKPGVPLRLTVRRAGVAEPLQFRLVPEKARGAGLLSIGVAPGASTTLAKDDSEGFVKRQLERTGLSAAGVEPGMTIVRVNDLPTTSYGQIDDALDQSQGQPVATTWQRLDSKTGKAVSQPIVAMLDGRPEYEVYRQGDGKMDGGLLGLSPLVLINRLPPDSPNSGLLQEGDVLLRVGNLDFPRASQLADELKAYKGGEAPLRVLRNGQVLDLNAKVNRKGMLKIELASAEQVMITAQPIASYVQLWSNSGVTKEHEIQTPIRPALLAGTRIESVGGQPVDSWPAFREQLRRATQAAQAEAGEAAISITITHPTVGREREEVAVELAPDEIARLHALGWTPALNYGYFESLQVTRSAKGRPLDAIGMGFEETHKIVMMTYLTIDRLFRGSVGIEQLHGPVGIVHLGSKIADRGFMYMVFFLGMISVNLAVINFLPLPIVDGGLFLFLIYERFKGRPPSIAFQNAATVVGLFLIGTIFLVVTWNDLVRLLG